MGNSPNVSRDSFSFSSWRDLLILQQNVPVLDSDWNEQSSILAMQSILALRALYGSTLIPPEPGSDSGFMASALAGQPQNLRFSAGYAIVEGALVPSTTDETPQDFDYEDDTNYITSGVVTSITTSQLEDTNKRFESWLDLVGCRIKMTSGAESGNESTIVSVINLTTLEFGVGDLPGVVGGDTYIIKPPEIPIVVASTPVEFHLWVWWEYVNESLDTTIVHSGVAMETCERLVRRWVVRLADALPSGSLNDFDIRGMVIATATLTPGSTEVTPVVDDSDFADPSVPWTKPFAETTYSEHVIAAATSITLPEDSYFVGKGTAAAAYKYFQLYWGYDASDLKPLVGSDGGPIYVNGLYLSGSPVTPSVDADENGFIHGALEIRFDLSQTSDSFVSTSVGVKHAVRRTLYQMATVPSWGPESMVMRGLPSRDVWTPDRSSAVNSVNGSKTEQLDGDRLDAVLTNLLTEMRKRPTTECPIESYGTPGWKYLLEVGTPGDTVVGVTRLYWFPSTGELFWLRGGTLSGISRDITAAATSVHVSGLVGSPLPIKVEALTATMVGGTYSLDSLSTWDSFQQLNSLGFSVDCSQIYFTASSILLGGLARCMGPVQFEAYSTLFTGSFEGMTDDRQPRDAGGDRILLYEASNTSNPSIVDGSVRVYLHTYSTVDHLMALEIVTGAYWDSSSETWKKESWSGGVVTSASMFCIRGDGSFISAAHRFSSEWEDHENDGGWDSWQKHRLVSSGSGWTIPEAKGTVSFRQKFALQANTQPEAKTLCSSQGITWPVKCDDIADSGSSITLVTEHENYWDIAGTASANLTYVDEWGCIVYGISETVSVSEGSEAHFWGYMLVEAIRD